MDNTFILFAKSQYTTDSFTKFLDNFVSNDYRIQFDGMWKHYHLHSNDLPQAGWKGHIAAMPENMEEVFSITFKILSQEKCEFKVARSREVYEALADPHAPVTEANKFITFSPQNDIRFREISKKLFNSLKKFSAPAIFTDYQLSNANPVQFRFGAFKEMKKWDPDRNEYVQLMILPSGKIIEDNRENIFSVPDGLKLPFTEEDKIWVEDKNVDSGLANNLEKYSFDSIMSQKNKGDVYLGRVNDKRVIIKSANPYVKNRIDTRSAHQLLDNEIEKLRILKDTDVVPEVFDTFSLENEKFEVIAYIDGITLDSPIANKKREDIILSLCKTVYKLHSKGLVIVDLTNNNFIYNSNGTCYLVNLEYVQFENAKLKREGYTPYYIPKGNRIPTQKEDIFSLAVTILGILFKCVPKYTASSLTDAINALKKQIYIQKKLKPDDSNLLNIPLYLLNIVNSSSIYNPIDLLYIERMILDEDDEMDLYSTDQLRKLLMDQKKCWKKNLNSKFKDSLLAKNWNTSDFGNNVSQLSIQNGVMGIARSLEINPWENVEKVNSIVTKESGYKYSDSYLFGSCSVLWEAVYQYQENKISYSLLKSIVVSTIASWKKQENDSLDFALGISGQLYTLIYVLLSEVNLDFLLKKIQSLHLILKDKLYSNPSAYNLIAAGFAHGLAGEAYVLLISSIYLKDKEGIKLAINKLQYLDDLLSNKIKYASSYANYMDLSWCEGISGIATALLRSQFILDKTNFSSLKYVPEYLLNYYTLVESNLCHGRESIIDYLNDVRLHSNSTYYNEIVELLINFEVSTAENSNETYLNFFDETGYTHNLDYGTGQVGIVESCLRALNDEDRLFFLTVSQEKTLQKRFKSM